MQGLDVRVCAGQPGRDTRDLGRAGQEGQDVAVLLGERPSNAGRDVVEEPGREATVVGAAHPGRQRAPDLGDRVERGRYADHRRWRRAPEEGRGALRLDRGGHRDEQEIGTQVGADLDEHRQGEVGVQLALVDLVEHDGRHPGQPGIALQPAEQDAGGDELDPGAGADLAIAAHGVADGPPDRLTEQVGEPACRRPGGDPARLGHDHQSADVPRDSGRDERRLAGARRCLDDGGPGVSQGGDDPGEAVPHGEDRRVREQPPDRVVGPGARGQRSPSTWSGT